MPSEPIERLIEGTEGWDSLEALATLESAAYLAKIWPWFQRALETLRRYKRSHDNELTYELPYVLDFRFENEGNLGLPEPALLASLRVAAETLASTDPEAFLSWVGTVEHENATCAQRLFAHALSTRPEHFASKALEFLISDGRRFNLGNVEDFSGTTKRLIEAVSPHWTAEDINEFVDALCAFSPRPAADRDVRSRQIFYHQLQRIRYELAAMLPRDRLPPKAAALVTQGERRFGDRSRGATFSGPTWVGPSMSAGSVCESCG